jgi:hypothetical protein
MGMVKKFASIEHPEKYGYAYDSECWNRSEHVFLNRKFRMFETYGDGLCRHSDDWSVSEDFATDYMNSLALAMIEDEELCKELYFTLGQKPADCKMVFAASLIYGEKDKEWTKRRYYSISLEKVTRNREKEHDDRYKEIAEWNNGTPEAIYRAILPEYADGLERWQYAQWVREWSEANLKQNWMEMPAVFLKWFREKSDAAREFRDSFECCWDLARAYALRESATNHLKYYRERIETRKMQADAVITAPDEEKTA